jgi:hypothetical protein
VERAVNLSEEIRERAMAGPSDGAIFNGVLLSAVLAFFAYQLSGTVESVVGWAVVALLTAVSVTILVAVVRFRIKG